MEFLPQELEDIINEYKIQIETHERLEQERYQQNVISICCIITRIVTIVVGHATLPIWLPILMIFNWIDMFSD